MVKSISKRKKKNQKDRKGEKGKAQKDRGLKKNEKPNDVGHFLIQKFNFCVCPSEKVIEHGAVERKARCHVANAFLS